MIDKRATTHFSYEEIASLVEPGSTVLDLGCGDGELLQLLRETRDATVRGVDIEEEMIRECLSKGISVFQGDLDEGLKEHSSASYDYVILNETLQQVHEPVQLMKEMVRVGRHAIVNFPNFGYVVNRWQLVLQGRMPVTKEIPYQWHNTPNIHFCTRRDFKMLCNALDIEIISSIDMRYGKIVRLPFRNLASTECCFLLRGRHASDN